MKKLYDSRAFWMIVSLLASLAIWVYVTSMQSTEFSQTFYGVEVELIRMRKVGLLRVENDLGVRAQHLAQHTVGAVPAPGQRQRPVEHRAIVPPPVDRQCVFRNALRSDRVRAGRSAPDAIEFFQRFHGSAPCVFFVLIVAYPRAECKMRRRICPHFREK